MSYLLDTNVCIQLLKTGAQAPVARKLAQVSPSEVVLCTPVVAELHYGAYKSAKPQENVERLQWFTDPFDILPFDVRAAQTCGRLWSDLALKGALIGPYDLQIAAISVVNALTLVTHNVDEFSRVVGLSWEDWEAQP